MVAGTIDDAARTAAVAEGVLLTLGVSGSGKFPGSVMARDGEKGDVGSMVERTVEAAVMVE